MRSLFLLLLVFCLFSCEVPTADKQTNEAENPPAPGFNAAESDAEAIAIADSVMLAMGGRKAWDETEFIKWTFFGRRTLEWNKKDKTVKVNIPADSTVIELNMKDTTGTVSVKGQPVTNPDTLRMYLEQANSIWINDSYWLVMPFKLKDSGVTLTYQGQDTTKTGSKAEVLQLTFNEVGDTPQNKYLVYVNPETWLVDQWAFFPTADGTEPRFVTPWRDYKPYGKILLSGDREMAQLSDISVR